MDTERQKGLGFFGRSVIHPRQLQLVHTVFDPTLGEVAAARILVQAYEAAEREGRGAIQTGGRFVDLAVVRGAKATIELHERRRRDVK